jgi:hypothetical protein
MLLELAVIDTVGMEAAALVANNETATKVRKGAREGIVFTGTCLIFVFTGFLKTSLVDCPELSFSFEMLGCRFSSRGCQPRPRAG